MLRFDTSTKLWREVDGTAALARALVEAGAPVDGLPGDHETPLITAASYGDAEVLGFPTSSSPPRPVTSKAGRWTTRRRKTGFSP